MEGDSRESEWRERLRVPEAKDLIDGESWYLLSCSWSSRLFSGETNPGPVDNGDLLDEKGALKVGLTLRTDFLAINKLAWNDLVETFTLLPPQDPIPRAVQGGQLAIYPSDLNLLKEKILAAQFEKLLAGESWYLVENRWFEALKKYLEDPQDDNCPGPIDSSTLLTSNGELKHDIYENIDFHYVDKSTWDIMAQRFSITPDQQPIERKVVMDGKVDPNAVIDIYPLHVFLMKDKNTKMKFQCSKYDTGDTLIEKVQKALNMKSNVDIKIKVESPVKDGEVFANLDSEYIFKGSDVVDSHNLEAGSCLSVEEHNENHFWSKGGVSAAPAKNVKIRNKNSPVDILISHSDEKKEPAESTYSSFPTRYSTGPYSEGCEEENARPGICGLSNLGNTCFMNSIIQVLSNTPPITEYFANDNYVEDINKTNPLGMKGEIAKTFGEMIKLMWSGRYKYINPRSFKSAVGRFAPQFSGYQQQDSQELLTFLLDGLHEDLNRVKKKPYIEIKDSGDRPDEEVAMEAWEVYKKRNDSVILDVFHGLLKSTLICPVCSKVSVTFDPFCYLSLPLPDHRERQLKVRVIWYEKSKLSTLYKLTVPKAGTISDLLKVLSKETDVPVERFKATEIFNNKIHREFDPDNALSLILERDDTFVYELPPLTEEYTYSTILFKEERIRSSSQFFHSPIIIRIKRGITGETLYDEVLSHIDSFLKKPIPDDFPTSNEDSKSSSGGINNNASDALAATTGAIQNSEDKVDNEESSLASDDVKMNLGEDDESILPNTRSMLFKLSILNVNGSVVDRYIELAEENLFAAKSHFIGLEWTNENKKLYFNDRFASKVEHDASVDRMHQKVPIKLSDCLELYTTTEKLGEDDAWYCPRCSEHQQATKKFDLWSLPSILVISLKRFSYTRNWRDKLDTLVDFPIKGLDMSPYIINPNHDPAIYDLIAVSNHYGGMGGGHYTAMAQNKNDGEWYYFDDAGVYPKKEKDVATNAAYVLFYRRRETRSKPSSTCTSAYNNTHVTNGLNNGVKGKNGNLSSSSGEEEEKMDVN